MRAVVTGLSGRIVRLSLSLTSAWRLRKPSSFFDVVDEQQALPGRHPMTR